MRSASLLAFADSIMSVAVPTLEHDPLHGLQRTPGGNANGWYIWVGEYSWASDFFSPLYIAHTFEKTPEVLKSFDLPLGCRFLLAKDYAGVRSQLRP
jgi:hypothetical protein